MNLKHLLFAAVLFIWVGYSNAQSLEFVKGNVRKLIVSGDKLFIETYDSKDNKYGIWASDGTANGTKLLKKTGLTGSNNMVECNGLFYFFVLDAEYYVELWATDGTVEGTFLVKELKPARGNTSRIMAALNHKLYLFINDGEHGNELWVSDGRANGTKLFKDIYPGSSHGLSDNCTIVYKDRMYFNALRETNSAKYGFDVELWVTDGTEEGTKLFKDINPTGSSFARNFAIANNKLYFSAITDAEDAELWVSDGTESGTHLIKDISHEAKENYPGPPTEYNGKAYFVTQGYYVPYNLWVTDGTEKGTTLIENEVGYKTVVINGALYFSKIISKDSSDNYALFKTNGEPGGASLVKAIEGGSSTGYPVHFRAANGKWYFAIYDSKDDYDYSNIWETDGTTENTKLVRDNQGELLEEDREYDLISYNNALFFVMEDENSGSSLYRLGSPSTAVADAVRENLEVVLFPNPTNHQLTLKTKEKLIGSNYTILNITGQTVRSGKITSNHTLLKVGNLHSGIYLVQIQSENGGFTSRFIKE